MDFFVDFQSSLLRGREMCFYVLNDNFLKQYFALKKVFQVMQKKFFQVFFSTSVFLEHIKFCWIAKTIVDLLSQ